ncbi:MAG TPA: hypothetical protein VNA20_05510 [Frankiaceae bacterium]|nr:hypothetical protein [Frankiaceae bacterium]
MTPSCPHPSVVLLNQWELLRKFVCQGCGAVLTCACCRDLANYVLPHQAAWGATAYSDFSRGE